MSVFRRVENPAQLRHQLLAILATLQPVMKGDARCGEGGLGGSSIPFSGVPGCH